MKYGRITAGKEGFRCQGWSLFYFSSVDGWNLAQYELPLVVYPAVYRVLQTLPWWWVGIQCIGIQLRHLVLSSRWWRNHHLFPIDISCCNLDQWFNGYSPRKRPFTALSAKVMEDSERWEFSDPPMRTKKTAPPNGRLNSPPPKKKNTYHSKNLYL